MEGRQEMTTARKYLEDMAIRLSWSKPNLKRIMDNPVVKLLWPVLTFFMKPAVRRRDTVPRWLRRANLARRGRPPVHRRALPRVSSSTPTSPSEWVIFGPKVALAARPEISPGDLDATVCDRALLVPVEPASASFPEDRGR